MYRYGQSIGMCVVTQQSIKLQCLNVYRYLIKSSSAMFHHVPIRIREKFKLWCLNVYIYIPHKEFSDLIRQEGGEFRKADGL